MPNQINPLLRRAAPLCVLAAVGAWVTFASSAIAATAEPAWTITIMSGPTNFAPGDHTGRDTYLVTATNSGGAPTSPGAIKFVDTLPAAVTLETEEKGPLEELTGIDEAGNPRFSIHEGTCKAGPPIECEDLQEKSLVQPGESVQMNIPVDVASNAPSSVLNSVSVSGGGALSASASVSTEISASPVAFGFLANAHGFDGAVSDANGSTPTQAGAHPYQTTLSFVLNNNLNPQSHRLAAAGEPKNVTANLPVGFIVDPNATATKCTEVQLETDLAGGGCPDSSQVGTVRVTAGQFRYPSFQTARLYNMVAPHGWPADLGFDALGLGIYVHLRGLVRTGGDYGLSATSNDILQEGQLLGFSATLWGDPSDPSHDAVRGQCFRGGANQGTLCPGVSTNTALLTLPTKCSGPLTTTIEAESWQEPNKFIPDSFESHDSATPPNPVGVSGCQALDFSPSITVKPDTTAAESPSGLKVDLHIPQNETPNGLAEANLKDAVVALPPGMTVNPSEANGLQACSPAQIDLHGPGAANCPDASKIGSVEVGTPLLDHPLPGSVYLAAQGDNPFSSLLAIYIAIDDPVTGVVVKLAGHVEANPVTGQLTTIFANNPQLPFSDFKLSFFGGPRAPLITPAGCGIYTTTTSLTPWSETPAVTPADTFPITTGCGGGFAPSFSAGTKSNQAAGYSPFTVTFSRQDREQRLRGITVRTSPGLLGKIAGIPQCPETQANAGTCSAQSQIGSAAAGAGAGPEPFFVPGAGQPANPVYLTGPYKGAPFGLSIVTHALAGPFDLGNVVVRAAIYVDPHTAVLTVVSDPLPTILQGIPLDIRTVNVMIDRPEFMFNPTSCDPMQIAATLTSLGGASTPVSSHFQAAGCSSLTFNPSFRVSTKAKTSKAGGASLDVKVAAQPGEANIHKVNVSLPLALPSRLTTLHKACTEKQFAINPAGCPEGSFVGVATAHTPVLNVPLTGPAILVSHGGEAFPDLDILLQGEGILIDLVGNTNIKKGITFSRFETVPDAPISSFELKLPEGPHSILTATGNLCKPTKTIEVRKRVLVPNHGHPKHVTRKVKTLVSQPLIMPTTITGQNGAVLTQTTKISVTGCPKAKKVKAKQVKKHKKTSTKRR